MESTQTSRRDALKKAALGAGVVGVAWSAPKVEGLSLRPNYAAAQSGPSCASYTVTAPRVPTGSRSASYSAAVGVDHPNVGAVSVFVGGASVDNNGLFAVRVIATGVGLTDCVLNVDAADPVASFTTNPQAPFGPNSQNTIVNGAFGMPANVTVSGTLCCD